MTGIGIVPIRVPTRVIVVDSNYSPAKRLSHGTSSAEVSRDARQPPGFSKIPNLRERPLGKSMAKGRCKGSRSFKPSWNQRLQENGLKLELELGLHVLSLIPATFIPPQEALDRNLVRICLSLFGACFPPGR